MSAPRWAKLNRAGVVACLLAVTPLNASAQACEAGTISEITFDRQKPFPPEVTAEEASLSWAFRGMNSVHITTREQTVRWELLFEEGDCLDLALLQDSERNLRTLPYIVEAEVESERLADGSYRVHVATQDVWAIAASLAFSFDGGFTINGFSANAKNLFGTGTSVGYFSTSFRERKRTAGLARQPNLFGSRVDATFHGGNTRVGSYYSQSFLRPFTGEGGRNAFRQLANKRDDYFAYSVDPTLEFSQALIRLEAEYYEASYQRRFGDVTGTKFVAGLGLSREEVRFPFGAAGVQVVLDDDYDVPFEAPSDVLDEVSTQMRRHATNRVSFTVGVRNLHFGTRNRLDAMRSRQDILQGMDFTLTVAPGFRSGDDTTSDVLTRAQGSIGFEAGKLYLNVDGDFQARKVSSDDEGGATGWRDVLWEVNGTGYWAVTENSTLFGRVFYTSGSRMDRPFQLTLGGREAVRGYTEDDFPGARRMLATLEQRIPFPRVDISILDLGLAGFVDAGKVWAGAAPWGVDSDWEASLGVGIRLRAAAGGPNVFRADFALPVTAEEGQRGVVFRFYAEIHGLLDRRTYPTQTARSRWYGIDPDLTTRPTNPFAGN